MKSVFYTCVTGPDNGYVHDVSNLENHGFDFVAIHDSHHDEFPGWRSINIDEDYPYDKQQYGHKQRYAKTMPQKFLSAYEYSVFLDPKWEITEDFLKLCSQLIEEHPQWKVAAHPSRSSLYEEFLFPFSNGTLSYAECVRVIDVLIEEKVDFNSFFSSLCTWIVRRHDDTTQKIGERWFELIQKCYEGNVRDQILFPFAVSDPAIIDRTLTIEELYETGVRLNYPNQTRVKTANWRHDFYDLIAYLHGRTGLIPQQREQAESSQAQ
ncbi:MAG: hypothetical protein GKR91_17090 [Pseudomonadales bacterium]|nr:hypothetical protein [Pseudomonadales bacterium]